MKSGDSRDRRKRILLELLESEEFVSGQRLCETLDVSRTAVWKIIGSLREEGYRIEAVTNRGYRLLSSVEDDILNEAEIAHCMRTQWAGHTLVYHRATGSTNADAQGLADGGARHGLLVVAGQQTAGRGRRGRTWVSPPDVNIYMSILLHPQMTADRAPMLTLVMALAVREALDAQAREEGARLVTGIKWPNDIVVMCPDGHWRKIAGILTEMRLEDTEIRDVVIGTGINVNMSALPEELAGSATSIFLASGRSFRRAALTARIWQEFERIYPVFVGAGNLSPLRERYEAALVNIGRRVRVLDPQAPFEGEALGITDRGGLLVRPEGGGEPRAVSSGEISVRGVEGYV